MDVAKRFAQLSTAERLKVGAIAVKDDRIISIGYNGTPGGWDNTCEEKVFMAPSAGPWLEPDDIEKQWPFLDLNGRYKLVTKDEVLHAESNCLSKLARTTESGLGATMFVTHSPCLHCAKMIYQSGFVAVFYDTPYRNDDGILFLRECGIDIREYTEYT